MRYTQCENWEEYKTNFMERFTLEDNYALCGIGGGFYALMELFPQIKVQYCLDKRASELSLPDKEVFPYEILKQRDIQTQRFIITASRDYYSEIKQCLLSYGVDENRIAGVEEILSFWGERYRGEAYPLVCSFILLTHCNLRCRSCVHLTPYIKQHQYNSLESVIRDMEKYFRIFPYVKELVLMGGETMLYKELGQLLSYVRLYFSDRYYRLRLVTNGLIAPEESAIMELSKLERPYVSISDYSCSIDKDSNKLIGYLTKYGVPYTLNSFFGGLSEYQWFDVGDPTQLKDGDAGERFRKCSAGCHYITNGKIYYCAPSYASDICSIAPLKCGEVCLDLDELEKMAPDQRIEQVERFDLGFMEQECLEACRFCNGYGADVNTKYTRPGEQW